MTIPYIKTRIDGIKVVQIDNPLFAQIELTSGCPYACGFCYNVWKGLKMKDQVSLTREEAFQVADTLINAGIFSGILSGGEPTVMSYLPELVGYFSAKNVPMTVITNGSLLTEDLVKKLVASEVDFIQVSIHHYRKTEMDRITNTVGSYERTLLGLKNVIKHCQTNHYGVNMVVTKSTVEDVFEMGQFVMSLGVRNFSTSLVSFSGAAVQNSMTCNVEDFRKVFQQLERLSSNMGVGIVGGYPTCILPEGAMDGNVQSYNHCDAGISQIVVGPDGNLRPCVEMGETVGNIFKDNLSEVWRKSKILKCIRRFDNVPDYCLDCSEVAECHGGCRASAYNATGNIKGFDPLMEVQDGSKS